MKRSDMLQVLARRLSNRDVDDIYEAAISEMKYVQEAVLEKLPSQPWFLQTEVFLPLPLGIDFVEMPIDYNGIMTEGGVWVAEATLSPAFTCNVSWAEVTLKYADKEVSVNGNKEVRAAFTNDYGASFMSPVDAYQSSGGYQLLFQDGENYLGVGVFSQADNTFFILAGDNSEYDFYTTDADFAADEFIIYYRPVFNSFYASEIEYTFTLIEIDRTNYSRDSVFDAPILLQETVLITAADFAADPTKIYKISFSNPGAFNAVNIIMGYIGIEILDTRLCKDGALMEWPLNTLTN